MLRRFTSLFRGNRAGPPICKQLDFPVRENCNLNVDTMDGINAMKKLGYMFNSDGQLRKINKDGEPSNEPFQFNVSDQHQECQAHYEELGAAITDYVYHLLEKETNLYKLPVPKDKNGTFIYVSQDYFKKDVLVILIHGSGAVRAGQWARSLIINENLDKGTQLPYIKRALAKDYGVMVLNPNDNCLPNGKTIKNSSTAEEHASYVWKTYISQTEAKSLVIIAHSYGGLVTVMLENEYKKDFENRVKAVAFTDSVHIFSQGRMSDFMKKVARNWISSPDPLDAPETTPDYDITRVSAGHQKHEMTSYACIESVFRFIDVKLSEK